MGKSDKIPTSSANILSSQLSEAPSTAPSVPDATSLPPPSPLPSPLPALLTHGTVVSSPHTHSQACMGDNDHFRNFDFPLFSDNRLKFIKG